MCELEWVPHRVPETGSGCLGSSYAFCVLRGTMTEHPEMIVEFRQRSSRIIVELIFLGELPLRKTIVHFC